jgi:nuclear pore complex protein Nup160
MNNMASATVPAPIFHQETYLSLTPPSANTILDISTGTNSSIIPFGAGRKRAHDEISGLDEDSYARKHLATEGSVFFRPKNRSPRSFLWRVLDDRQLLEVQCVDLIEDKRHRGSDSWLTFRVSFPERIVPNGVVLADGGEKDALDIFALAGDSLYTITLRRDLLVRETLPSDFDSTACVKKYSPSNFQFRRPFRIAAVSSLELFISLQDGGLMRLQRQAHESGSQWRETYFSEGGWSGTLKKGFSLFNRQTVKYGDITLETNALAAVAPSLDRRIVWTVGLDHLLRAWSVRTGKIVAQKDLLTSRFDPEEKKKQPPYIMGAEQGTLLQIVDSYGVEGVAYFVVLHSPKDHEFKFYAVKSEGEEEGEDTITLSDAQLGVELIAPIAEMMGTTVWHLEQFNVSPGLGWQDCQIWVRARSGALCRTFTLKFDLMDHNEPAAGLAELWRKGWTMVDNSHLSVTALRETPDFLDLDIDAETVITPSEKWLKFLFYPGRFSEASLETALNVYRTGRGLPMFSTNAEKEQPLKERITSSVAAKVLLRRGQNEQPDYDRYQMDLQAQWQTYFSLLSHLHSRRHESIGFALDPEDRLAWQVSADFVAPVRLSSGFELVCNHARYLVINADMMDAAIDPTVQRRMYGKEDELEDNMFKTNIISVARQFRRFLSTASQQKLRRTAVQDALDQNPEKTPIEALQFLYEHCNIPDEITNDDFEAISDSSAAINGLGNLTDDDFLMILESYEDIPIRGQDHGKVLQRYGKELSIAIAQETLQHTEGLLLDLLALVVFMHGDLEQDELSPEFRPAEIYDAIILRLRQTELRLWLVSHVRLEPKKISAKKEELMAMTLYESIFIGDWQPRETKDQSMADLITIWSKNWTFGVALGEKWDAITDYILANLLRAKDLDLATDFVKFVADTTFASYLKARLYLATGEYELASLSFKQAAEELSRVQNPANNLQHAGLLDGDEINYFGQGYHAYYQHVSALYEKLTAFSYTADFAMLALQHLESPKELRRKLRELDLRKSQADSPAKQRIEDAQQEIHVLRLVEARDHLLGRLFTALTHTGRFAAAHDALAQINNPALRHSNLHTLLTRCIRDDAVPTLLGLPLRDDLALVADQELAKLAKRSMGTANSHLSGPPYHQILFAFRSRRGDFRGAAGLLYMHLQYLTLTNPHAVKDPDDDTLLQAYILLINTLACCSEEDAWLLAEPIEGVHPAGTKRKLVRLEDVRREYVAELDRRSEIQMGRFPFGADDMDMF